MSNAMGLLDCTPCLGSNLRHLQPAANWTSCLLGEEVSLTAGCRHQVVIALRRRLIGGCRAPLLNGPFEKLLVCRAARRRNGFCKGQSEGANEVEARGTRLDLDRFLRSGGAAENAFCTGERPHSEARFCQASRNKERIVVLAALSGGRSGVDDATQSVGAQVDASSGGSKSENGDASRPLDGAEDRQPVASTSGRGETDPLSGADFKSGRRGSWRGEASRQCRDDVGVRTQAGRNFNTFETESGDSSEAKERRKARACDVVGDGRLGENGRGRPALGARAETDERARGGLHSGGVSGNGVGSEGLEAHEGARKEARLHTDERTNAGFEERRPQGGGSALERGGNAKFAPGLQSFLSTLKSANNSPAPPSASASFPDQRDDPRAWRRPLPPADAPETAPPRRNRRRSKARQLEPNLVTQVVEELKREPQWGNIAGILDKWEGRTSLRNYELLMKELCWQGDYLRSVKAFAWMKEQRKWYRPRVEIYNHLLQMLARYGKLDFIRGLFKEMDLYSVTPTTDSWQALISAHGKAGSTEGAVWAFEEMQRRGVPANNWSYNCLLSAFAHGREWRRALEYLDKMQADGISPDRVTFNTVLSACRNGGEFERAIDIFESLPKLGICPNRVTCNTMITVYSRIGHFEKVTALFEEMLAAPGGSQQRPDLLTYNSVLQAYSVSGDIEKAGALFDRMLQHGPRPSLVTWNTLMSAYAKLGRHEEARALLLRLRQYGKRPDVVSYSTLLSAYAKAGLAREARGVFEEMINEGVKPNAVTYNAVMDAYAKANDHAAALTWLEKMRADGVTPNVVTYTTLINACGRAGRIEEAARVLDEAGESSVNVVTFNAMIHSCGANDAFDAAIRVFDAMRGAGLQPNVATYNGVLDSFGRAGKLDQMEQAFQQMLREGLVPTVETFTIMIDLYGKKGLPEEAWRTFEAMKAAGCPPNIVTMTSLINACAKGNMYYEGLLAWQELLAMGLEPDVVTYGALIEMCNKNGNFDVALEFGEKMRDRARRGGWLKPNLVIYNQLLAAAGRQRDFDLCVELFQELQDNGHMPNNWTFHALMDAFGSAGRPDKVERIFREMQNVFGIEANLVSYNLLVGAYARVINSRALDILEEMKGKGISPSVMTYNWVLMYMRKAGTGPQKAIRLFAEMVAGGIAPTAISYIEMVRVLQRAGMDEEAAAMQKELELVQGDEAIMRVAELTSERRGSLKEIAEVDSGASSDLKKPDAESEKSLGQVGCQTGWKLRRA